jgi:hypothetical protein
MSADVFEVGKGLPGWTLRALIAATSGAIILLLMAHGIGGAAIVLLIIAALISIVLPASPAPTLALVIVAVGVVAFGSDSFAGYVLALVPLVHLLHVTCAIAGMLPLNSRVHLAALRVPAIRFASIQAAVFALAGMMALVPAGRLPAALEFTAILGLAGIAVLVIWLLNRPH